FRSYTIAYLKGEDTATLETPPNHKLFNEQQVSPVLLRRLGASKNAAAPAPVVNFSLGNEISDLFHPIVCSSTSALGPSHTPDHNSCYLLLPSHTPGMDRPISEFCDLYALGPDILEKFASHLYKNARVLRFVTLVDLKEMRFRLGEIAGLWDAVELWLVQRSS
ncbi:hypothetical protein F5888DRAFT_1617725, partial [Russula emetica]